MGKFGVSPKKEAELLERMRKLNIKEEDLEEKFITSRGPGGQKTAHSSSGVYLKHIPTQIEVKTDTSRSLALNRFLARRRLCELIELQTGVKDSPLLKKITKIKKQKLKKRKRSKMRKHFKEINERNNSVENVNHSPEK